MSKRIPLVLLLLSAIGLLFAVIIGSAQETSHPSGPVDFRCEDCHQCDAPSKANPCLRECPRPADISTEKIPEIVVLDEIANLYGPTQFNHEAHAQMAGTGDGCAVCHFHYPPGHVYGNCSDCHKEQATEENLGQPSLKAIYHRKCLACHQEWSHETGCDKCHIRKGEEAEATAKSKKGYPKVHSPSNKRVWQSGWEGGTVITFFHQNHVNLYGVTCAECHQHESCDYCHDVEQPRGRALRTPESIHHMCDRCHSKKNCQFCHRKEELPAFSHEARTGWPLNRFHQSLSCQKCHKQLGMEWANLSRQCESCHKDWNYEAFNHAKTVGVALDEIHKEMDCGDCHENRDFSRKPTCAACHDDGRKYPNSKPGP
jgi:hypothetical protein